jgi:hypothetical protein
MINHKTKRFYCLLLQQDLFGIWCVRKIYGGLTNKYCREIWKPFNSQQDATKDLADLEYKRIQRGYIYADIPLVEYYYLRPQNHDEIWIEKPNQVKVFKANTSVDLSMKSMNVAVQKTLF